jgi:hypothetical protein
MRDSRPSPAPSDAGRGLDIKSSFMPSELQAGIGMSRTPWCHPGRQPCPGPWNLRWEGKVLRGNSEEKIWCGKGCRLQAVKKIREPLFHQPANPRRPLSLAMCLGSRAEVRVSCFERSTPLHPVHPMHLLANAQRDQCEICFWWWAAELAPLRKAIVSRRGLFRAGDMSLCVAPARPSAASLLTARCALESRLVDQNGAENDSHPRPQAEKQCVGLI